VPHADPTPSPRSDPRSDPRADPRAEPIPWPEARRVARRAVGPLPGGVVPLASAGGAVLAEDVAARTDLPATDVSAMDGWAVAGPPPWTVVGEVTAGARSAALSPSTAVAIATGAALPPGTDGVLRSERGSLEPGAGGPHPCLYPVLEASAHPTSSSDPPTSPSGQGILGRNDHPDLLCDIRRVGQECRAGEVVLAAGTRLGPAALGLLAAAGHDVVPVRRATVAVLVLGDELLGSGPARDGRLRDALGPLLSGWLPGLGVSVVQITRVPDRRAALADALAGCPADLVVTTGSTARGAVDHLHGVLERAGARLLVDGVAVRPGHPQLLALLADGRPLVGLPGNPLAAVSALLTLLHPVVDALHGRPEPVARWGVLAEDVSAGQDATRLVPVLDGRPVMFAGPAMLRGLATAEAIAVIPPDGSRAGEPVELLPLP
jgi:molybdopterin molybdotransferase